MTSGWSSYFYKVRQHLVNTVGLDCSYELRLQCELTLQTQLIGTIQPNPVHKVLPDLVVKDLKITLLLHKTSPFVLKLDYFISD